MVMAKNHQQRRKRASNTEQYRTEEEEECTYRQKRRYTYTRKRVGKCKKAVSWIPIGFNVDLDPPILKIKNCKNANFLVQINCNIFIPRHLQEKPTALKRRTHSIWKYHFFLFLAIFAHLNADPDLHYADPDAADQNQWGICGYIANLDPIKHNLKKGFYNPKFFNIIRYTPLDSGGGRPLTLYHSTTVQHCGGGQTSLLEHHKYAFKGGHW
jgi:hypothetical protein